MNDREKAIYEDVLKVWVLLQEIYLAIGIGEVAKDEWGPVSAQACGVFRKAADIFFRLQDDAGWTDAKPALHALVLRLFHVREAMHEHLVHNGSADEVLNTRAEIAERIARIEVGDYMLVWEERTGHA